MRFSFRLAELVNYQPDPKKRPGVIKAICEYTGLDRHQVAALLRNEVKNIPLSAISRLCDYLVEHGHTSAEQLPGALFAIEPENFWELLARRKRLELCVGVRRTNQQDWPDGAWVVASDLVLIGEVLNGVSTLGGTAKLRPTEVKTMMPAEGDGHMVAAPPSTRPHPEHLTQSLVWSPGTAAIEEVMDRAKAVYRVYSDSAGDKSLVCLGSTKSNPVVELVVASAFGCEPFQTQAVSDPSQRNCPFYLRFRDRDPHPDSCFGGIQLSESFPSAAPGIYFEQADGTWMARTCDDPKKDAAFVFYTHRESQGWMEMAMFGFSGRATRLLAKTLATRAEEFWPPVYSGYGLQIGAYVVDYTLQAEEDVLLDMLRTDLIANATITPLDAEVFRRRLEPSGTAKEKEKEKPLAKAK